MSPDEHTKLSDLVRAFTSTTRLVALIHALHRRISDRSVGSGVTNAIRVGWRSLGFGTEQTAFLDELVRQYGVKAVSNFIAREEQLRHEVQCDLQLVMKPSEDAEKYQGQYSKALKALDAFGIDHKEAPTWPEIAARLSPEKLALIEKLDGAQLILVPPLSRHDLVKAMNSKVGEHGMKHEAYTYEEDDHLWSNGKPEDLTWDILFVDGRQDVPYDKELQDGKTAHEQVKALRARHEQNGFRALTGVRAYLTLMMQGLVARKHIDAQCWTVLNPDVVAENEKALLGYGYWADVQVYLSVGNPNYSNFFLRLRGALRV